MTPQPDIPGTQDKALAGIRRILIAVGLLGTLLFCGLFLLTYANQDQIERTAQSFIQYQVKTEIRETNEALADSKYGEQLDAFKQMFGSEMEQVQTYLDDNLDRKIADAIAAMCRLDCDKREQIRKTIRDGMEQRLQRVGLSVKNVEDYIAGKYENVLESLKQDLRIFLGTNAILFALVALAMFIRKRASLQLIIPAGLLMAATLISICLYIFGQNWFYTLIYSDFWGYAYSVYAGLIFLCLLDVFLNQARVTTEIINIFLQLVGSALSAVSC